MKLHFEKENLSKKQECSALTGNLEGTSLNCVMAKRMNERNSARKTLDILLNCFGKGQIGTQETGSEVECHRREDRGHDKRGDKNNVNNIGRRYSGSKQLE